MNEYLKKAQEVLAILPVHKSYDELLRVAQVYATLAVAEAIEKVETQ